MLLRLFFAATLVLSGSVAAKLSYDYVDVNVNYHNYSASNYDGGIGYGLDVSRTLTKSFYFLGSYGDDYGSLGPADFVYQTMSLGLGYRLPLTKGLDLNLAYRYELNSAISVDGLDGARVVPVNSFDVGVRGALGRLGYSAGLNFYTVSEFYYDASPATNDDFEFGYYLSAYYDLSSNTSLGFTYQNLGYSYMSSSSEDSFEVNYRYKF